MADGSLVMGTAGTVKTQQTSGGPHVQVIRDQPASAAVAPVSWTATAAGSATVIAANADRTSVIITSRASSEVWIRFDATIPTLALHTIYLSPGERYEVPNKWARLAISLAASADGGYVLITQGTDA